MSPSTRKSGMRVSEQRSVLTGIFPPPVKDDSVNLRAVILLGEGPVVGRHLIRLFTEHFVVVFIVARDLRSIACREANFGL